MYKNSQVLNVGKITIGTCRCPKLTWTSAYAAIRSDRCNSFECEVPESYLEFNACNKCQYIPRTLMLAFLRDLFIRMLVGRITGHFEEDAGCRATQRAVLSIADY